MLKLQGFLFRAGFPKALLVPQQLFRLAFIESCFCIKLNSIFCPAPTVLTVQKKSLYVKVPFISYDQNMEFNLMRKQDSMKARGKLLRDK